MGRGQTMESKPAGVWIRVSTEDQAKGESPEHHERRARAYAESKGWRVREVYHLEGVSGKSVLGHPEAKRMLEHVASGHIEALIFSKLARLARNTRELLDVADHFRAHDAGLISLQESIDTTSPAGRLFYTMIAAMAQWEREEIAERVAASVPIRAKLGKPLGGAAPFGYRWENRTLVPDPNEAPVRKLLFELFAEHGRRKTVARFLNERGYRTRNGSKFSDTTVERLIRDPSAKGLRRANYTRSTGDKKHWVLKPEEDWVLTPIEAIVSEDLWTRCNAILDQRRAKGERPARRPVHLFSGVLRCSCGTKMYAINPGRYFCRACRNKVLGSDIEVIFQEQLKQFLLSPEDIASVLGSADEQIKAKEEQLRLLEAEASRVRSDMEKTHRLYLADQISPEGFGHTYRPLEARQKELEEEIPRLRGELDFLRIQYLSRDEVLIEAKDLSERWDALNPEEKRAIVEAIVEGIQVSKEEVQIDLNCFPGFAVNSEQKATRPHGFIAATSSARAG